MTADNHQDSGDGQATEHDVVEQSALLDSLYGDVLSLVSRTADFVGALKMGAVPGFTLDTGPAYTVESMRHTTRLMQSMAWLLTQRAVETGEMTAEEAADPKYQLGAADVCLATGVARQTSEGVSGDERREQPNLSPDQAARRADGRAHPGKPRPRAAQSSRRP